MTHDKKKTPERAYIMTNPWRGIRRWNQKLHRWEFLHPNGDIYIEVEGQRGTIKKVEEAEGENFDKVKPEQGQTWVQVRESDTEMDGEYVFVLEQEDKEQEKKKQADEEQSWGGSDQELAKLLDKHLFNRRVYP